MKAIVYENYGGPEVLNLLDVPIPKPRKNEILINVKATSVTTADWRIRSLSMPYGFKFIARLVFGFNRPRKRILGTELSGIVVAHGEQVTKFKIGDKVIAQLGADMGAYAEYCCLNENKVIVKMPDHLSFAEAATVSFGFTTAWAYLVDKAKVQTGQSVLIHGASGSVGTAAIQIAKHLGAQVTAVSRGQNGELVKSLGADFFVDYTASDFTKSGLQYDFILDCFGNLRFEEIESSLSPNGKFIIVSGELPQLLMAPLINIKPGKKIIAAPVADSLDTLQKVANLFAEKKLVPVIDRVFSLDEIREAHAYVDKRHRKGNVAIKVAERERFELSNGY
jgi:NADPH:quinone reductase-like Zn-dependent oxidoreductase